MPKVLSEQEIEQFESQGFVSPVPVLSATETAAFRDKLESFERRYPEHRRKLKTKSHLLCPWIVDIARHPRILDVYEDLIGPDILCYSMAWRIKEADGKTFAGWHQDTAYSPIDPILVIGALALSEISVAHGCLRVIPGSHNTGIMAHVDTTDPDSILARGQYISDDFDTSNAVDLVLQPGEIGLFNANIIHGSQINSADARRIMLLVEMMPACTAEREHRDSAMLVRGVDRYGNFDADPPARVEFGPAEQEAWQRISQRRGKNIFVGSKLPLSDVYGGVAAKP